jgi:Lsr2
VGRSMRRQRVDDIDGSQAAHTVAFALDGRHYEIDLSDVNATALREVFAPYVAAGRRAEPRHSATGTTAGVRARGSRRSGRGEAGSPSSASSSAEQSTSPPLGEEPAQVTPTAESPEAPLAEVVQLPYRPGTQAVETDVIGQRRQLAANVGELTRMFAVAILVAGADRLLALIARRDKTGNTENRNRNDTSEARATEPSSASSIAPAG